MISDGYGDETPAEVAARFSRWSHAIAGGIVNASSLLYDDLVQESLIAIWKAAEKRGVANVGATYLTQIAKFRMLEIAQSKKPMTGGDSTPGPKYRPSTVSVDWTDIEGDNEQRSTWAHLLEAADLLDLIEWGYHDGEIMHALGGLRTDHRDYVIAKYWHGMKDVEIAQVMGVDRKLLGTWWSRTIKPALQQRLAGLRTM